MDSWRFFEKYLLVGSATVRIIYSIHTLTNRVFLNSSALDTCVSCNRKTKRHISLVSLQALCDYICMSSELVTRVWLVSAICVFDSVA